MSNSTDYVAQSDIDAKTMEGGGSPVEETAAEVSAPEKSAKSAPEEKMVSLEDLEEEAEYSEKEFQEMLDLYEKTMSDFVEGELVIGKILAVNDKEVAVDIGFKSEGVIPIDEFSQRDPINVGDDIEVFLDNVEDSDGQLVLSKRKADFLRTWWVKLINAFNPTRDNPTPHVSVVQGSLHVMIDGQKSFMIDHTMAWMELAGSKEE
ncbi:S1 RNA-binding domain-containing protein [candidate division KSB1 bacterium]|nr:S1 RNA-binding domain-containing protein [candidate division KSB1 bacterium]